MYNNHINSLRRHSQFGFLDPATLSAAAGAAGALKSIVGNKLSHDAFFREMGNVDKAIARAAGFPESAATTNGNPLNDAIDVARAEGKFRYADVSKNLLKDYTPDLQRYVSQAGASILKQIGRPDLIPLLSSKPPYIGTGSNGMDSGAGGGSVVLDLVNMFKPGVKATTTTTTTPSRVVSSKFPWKLLLIGTGVAGIVTITYFATRKRKKA